MVIIKRNSNHGLNGSRSPVVVPRGPRSIRKRSSCEKRIEGNQLCAFELLATVAGKLLEETECSSASSSVALGFDKCGNGKDGIKMELIGGENDDQGSSEGSVYFSENQKGVCREKIESADGENVSPLVSCVCSEKFHSKLEIGKIPDDHDIVKISSKNLRDFPLTGESNDINKGYVLDRKLDVNGGGSDDLNLANKEEIVEKPLCREAVANDHFLNRVNDVKITCKDENENFSRCSEPNNTRKILRSPLRIGDRRFRKKMTYKYWKTVPKLKDYETTNAGGLTRHIYHSKRPCYEIDRSQRNTPFKKRRLFDRSSIVTYDGGISCESVSNSPEKSRDDKINALAEKLRQGNGQPSSGFRRQNSTNSRNSHVRLSIKSFNVPELFVEVPESTTVGSLKRTVLEAVTSILGGGLRVGVLLQGKKIRDDNRNLLQAGISENDDMDTIGFMLEPDSPTQPSPPLTPMEPLTSPLCDSPKLSPRSQVNVKKEVFLLGSLDKPSVANSNSPAGSSRDLVPSVNIELPEIKVSDSKALVPVQEPGMDALALMPMNQRGKRSEIGQRRTRRPFSVTEVEALVYAVEQLGTGRWRDVKLRSFENAMHRTYVDLKDKWKTLVHTARISPQQRRGEPVPQELLDRVLAAQTYWSEHQAKQHGKQQQHHNIETKLTDRVSVA